MRFGKNPVALFARPSGSAEALYTHRRITKAQKKLFHPTPRGFQPQLALREKRLNQRMGCRSQRRNSQEARLEWFGRCTFTMVMKRLLRAITRGRRLWKQLPADLGGGKICCSPEATLSVLKPGWSSEQALSLFEWARLYVKPGMRIWDLGSNQGLFTFAASSRAEGGEVVAFEPDAFLLSLLESSLATGSHVGAAIDVLPVAVAESVHIARFLISGTDRTLNHLAEVKGNPRMTGARASRSVMVVSLDWLGEHLPAPDLIKIDVEGAEGKVLKGGLKLLNEHRPAVIVEVAEECAGTVSSVFEEAGYLMFDIKAPEKGCIANPAWNTLALPAEKADSWLSGAYETHLINRL
jgi:FkbM family methyltransferase